jgi:hypothetical protein
MGTRKAPPPHNWLPRCAICDKPYDEHDPSAQIAEMVFSHPPIGPWLSEVVCHKCQEWFLLISWIPGESQIRWIYWDTTKSGGTH